MVSSSSSSSHQLAAAASDGDLLPSKDAARGFYQKYEPREVLGKGLSSVVRRCIHKQTGVAYAVKIMDISADMVDEEGLTLREQTRREADILHLVSGHQNIVTLHDVYESDTFIFLVFELCENGELFDYLTSKITLTEKRVRGIMKQVFEAVNHCHQMNIVHRDLKPENILLDEAFNVKLTDFGFAKVLQGGERLYEVCGTPGYLAPELLKAGMLERDECNGYGLEVDAWACGVIMYTLLVGCPPFWHRKQLTMIRLIMEARYSFASPEWDDVTDESKELISRLLVVDPDKRITIDAALQHPVFRATRMGYGSIASNLDLLELEMSAAPALPEAVSAAVPAVSPKFNARRAMRVALLCVRFLVRFQRLRFTPEPLSLRQAGINPYAMRMVRKVIDNNAFKVYNHWVKRGEGQNRAAIFEHFPKRELVKQAEERATAEAARKSSNS